MYTASILKLLLSSKEIDFTVLNIQRPSALSMNQYYGGKKRIKISWSAFTEETELRGYNFYKGNENGFRAFKCPQYVM